MQKVQRINKGNRDTILEYARTTSGGRLSQLLLELYRFEELASENGGSIGLISLGNVQFELEKVFSISDYQSQKLTWALIDAKGG